MARYNEILVGRLNRFLQKYLAMKGEAPAPQLASDWTPSILFDSPAADLRYLQGWETFGSFFNPPAAAGFNSGSLLRNPVGSNIIAVVERIAVQAGVATFLELSVGAVNADLGSVTVTTGFDGRGRQFGAGLKVSQNLVGGTVAGLGVVGLFNVVAAVNLEHILDDLHCIPLLPGFGCEIRDTTVNHSVSGAWKWRERFLEDSERT